MQGYAWAKTAENELFVVMVAGGKGFVPGVEGGIDLAGIDLLEPVQWPKSQNLPRLKPGALAADATRECVILPFAANG